ncbi:MAG: hypothetical protein FWF49_03805, partial [Oscillospiraceae bacterium]|nr:hypothetical protein [Oscillospiraceae bacterium]
MKKQNPHPQTVRFIALAAAALLCMSAAGCGAAPPPDSSSAPTLTAATLFDTQTLIQVQQVSDIIGEPVTADAGVYQDDDGYQVDYAPVDGSSVYIVRLTIKPGSQEMYNEFLATLKQDDVQTDVSGAVWYVWNFRDMF